MDASLINQPPMARSKLEAVSRISALTASTPETLGPGSKERKSVLINLARGLDFSVNVSLSKPELGAQIADQLGATWDAECWSAGQTITLVGLNRLLEGAQDRLRQRRQDRQTPVFDTVRNTDTEFHPARSKLEAVSRISALTHSPPQRLGPGSKERKSALVNLARGLKLPADEGASKPDLGRQLAQLLGEAWDASCWSAGHTVTLVGLNRLLNGAEKRLRHRQRAESGPFASPIHEASALLTTIGATLPTEMEGTVCVQEMHSSQYTQWAQDEWVGFYFEYVALPGLINTFGGGPRTFDNTRFDYGLAHTWDLKAHMAASSLAPLNDCGAIRSALATGTGLGFIVLTGHVTYDGGEFREWQRAFRVEQGKKPSTRVGKPAYIRKSKPRFTPGRLEAFYFASTASLDTAIALGAVRVMKQGVQATGQHRSPKYALHLDAARVSGPLVATHLLTSGPG